MEKIKNYGDLLLHYNAKNHFLYPFIKRSRSITDSNFAHIQLMLQRLSIQSIRNVIRELERLNFYTEHLFRWIDYLNYLKRNAADIINLCRNLLGHG